MELVDGAYPLLLGAIATADAAVAFKDVDAVILVGAFPRKVNYSTMRATCLNIVLLFNSIYSLAL